MDDADTPSIGSENGDTAVTSADGMSEAHRHLMTPRFQALFLCLIFVPLAGLAVTWAVRSFERADHLTAVTSLSFGVFATGLVAMTLLTACNSVRPRVTHDETGTTLRPDRMVDGFMAASTLGGFVGMLLYAVFAPRGSVYIPAAGGSTTAYVVTCAIGVVVGLPVLWQVIKQGGMSRLRLTVDGIEAGNSVTTKRRAWSEVADVADRQGGRRYSNGATYIVTDDGHTREVPTHWYTPGGHAVHEWVRFYWQHPQQRDELTDGRAVERLDGKL